MAEDREQEPGEEAERQPKGEAEREPKEEAKPKMPGAKAIGPAIVLLILAGYFLWMTEEMGTAAVSGAAPMFAFLGAAAVGVVAAGVAMALGRRR